MRMVLLCFVLLWSYHSSQVDSCDIFSVFTGTWVVTSVAASRLTLKDNGSIYLFSNTEAREFSAHFLECISSGPCRLCIPDTRRWNLPVPNLLMRCSDLTSRYGTRIVVPEMTTSPIVSVGCFLTLAVCPILMFRRCLIDGVLVGAHSPYGFDAWLRSQRHTLKRHHRSGYCI